VTVVVRVGFVGGTGTGATHCESASDVVITKDRQKVNRNKKIQLILVGFTTRNDSFNTNHTPSSEARGRDKGVSCFPGLQLA
jgi:hypothetical protein